MRRALALASLLAIFPLTACDRPPPNPADTARTVPKTPSYADVLLLADRSISTARWRIEQQSRSAYAHEELALAYMQRAKLTGRLDDYAEAEQALVRAFETAAGAGPLFSRASLNFALHRLPRVADDLTRLRKLPLDANNPEVIALAADLAFQQGQYPEALAGFRDAIARMETVPNLSRLAIWQARMGHYADAAALFDRAERLTDDNDGYTRAWIALQQGLLLFEQGGWPQALAQYRRAQGLLPGWWLAREHEAEILRLQGEQDAALDIYREVVNATGHPEYMDAIAQILLDTGHAGEARDWIGKARAEYAQRARLFPEASYGHALDHYLLFGGAGEALELAHANFRLRPNGAAGIRLAQALAKAGRMQEAGIQIRKVLATSWNTVELHAVASQIFALLEQTADSNRQSEFALVMNPKAFKTYPTLTTPSTTKPES